MRTAPPAPMPPVRAEPAGGEDGPASPPFPSAAARMSDRLGFRLAFLLALALLPLGLVGLLQAGAWRDAAREQAAAALMGETLRAAAPAVGLIREAQGAAAALAQTVAPLVGDDRACVAAVTALNEASPQYSIVVYSPASGLMTCGSGGRSFDYRGTPLLARMQADGFAPKVYVQARGPVSGVSVVLVVHPVRASAGAAPLGYVALALPHDALAAPGGERALALPVPDFVTFNGDGTVLTASTGFGAEAGVLPEGVALAGLGTDGALSFHGRTAAGEARDFAVVPVVPGTLYALGSWPARRPFALGPVAAAAPMLFIALMWAASLIVAWVAAERLVTRPMRGLAHALAAFAGGRREVDRLDLGRAPAELREVAAAFGRMTDTILHDEAELEDGLREREALLREVHHRSKNNLQLIVSIMNMQARRARDPEARALMRGLQERVMTLATVHRELYQATGAGAVRADELLGDVARHVVGTGPTDRRRARLETALAPLRLNADEAVPLALLLAEALSAAQAVAGGGPEPALRVALSAPAGREPGGRAVLLVEAPMPEAAGEDAGGGDDLGAQLLRAFAAQLGGQLEVTARGGTWRLSLAFPHKDA